MYRVNPELKRIQEERDRAAAARASGTGGRQGGGGVELTLTALENVRSKAEVEGFTFYSDEAVDGGGTGQAPAPLRYFYGGMLMCTNVWFVKGCVLTGATIDSLNAKMKFLGGGPIDIEMRVTTKESASKMLDALKIAQTRCPAYRTVAAFSPMHFKLISNGEVIADQNTSPERK